MQLLKDYGLTYQNYVQTIIRLNNAERKSTLEKMTLQEIADTATKHEEPDETAISWILVKMILSTSKIRRH